MTKTPEQLGARLLFTATPEVFRVAAVRRAQRKKGDATLNGSWEKVDAGGLRGLDWTLKESSQRAHYGDGRVLDRLTPLSGSKTISCPQAQRNQDLFKQPFYGRTTQPLNPTILAYLNRLSDWLFARAENATAGVQWIPKD